jgi:hypothetical protein
VLTAGADLAGCAAAASADEGTGAEGTGDLPFCSAAAITAAAPLPLQQEARFRGSSIYVYTAKVQSQMGCALYRKDDQENCCLSQVAGTHLALL